MNSAYGPSDPSQYAAMDHTRPFPNPNLSRVASGSPPAHNPYAPIPPSHHSYQHQQYQPPPPPPLPQPTALQQLPQQHHHHIQQEQPVEQQHALSLNGQSSQPPMHQHPPHQPPQSSYAPRNDSPPPTETNKEKDAPASQQLTMVSRAGDANGRRYTLDVVQQPKRARMCGYGDKDRRPITPPPCVRLVITDIATGKEVNYKDIDHTMFVLNVDLWNEQGAQEVNLCRQPASTGAPSLSATPTYSYTSSSGGDPNSMYTPQMLTPGREPPYGQPPNMGYMQDYASGYSQVVPSYPQNGGAYGAPQQFYPHDSHYSTNPNVIPIPAGRFDNGVPTMGYTESNGPSVAYVHDQYKGALNRNLIGSVAASAFCLVDTNDHEGIWFVLQDLSVRLEGTYRLKFSFVNVGMPQGPSRGPSTIIKGKAPILAWCFSDSFNVYSAKKFPGVCESTALSKTFATQGIKIPIRKDGNKGGDDDDID